MSISELSKNGMLSTAQEKSEPRTPAKEGGDKTEKGREKHTPGKVNKNKAKVCMGCRYEPFLCALVSQASAFSLEVPKKKKEEREGGKEEVN